MLDSDKLRRAVAMQHQSYGLLRWVADAVGKDVVTFGDAHAGLTMPAAGRHWIERHYANLPGYGRPDRADIPAFAGFFATYLVNSFDLVADPGRRLTSPCGCYCSWCAYLTRASHLKAKSLTPADKRRAETLKVRAFERIACDYQVQLPEPHIRGLLSDAATDEHAALLAYGHDLLARVAGVPGGPEVLALWRTFSRNDRGGRKAAFWLSADRILEAERAVAALVHEESVAPTAPASRPPR